MKIRRRIPSEIATAVGIERADRALAWTTDGNGRYIVATEGSLILQRNPPSYERIGWEAIDQASYADGVLSLTLLPQGDDAPAHLRIPVGDEPELPIAVRDRVTASIVLNQHVPLQGRRGVRVVARRRSGDRDLRWGYVFDSDLDADAVLRAQAARLVEQVRSESGLA